MNRSDLLILKTIKQSVEMRNSVCHSATICANALMHAGTTVDTFLRENLVTLKFHLFIQFFILYFDLVSLFFHLTDCSSMTI